MKKKAIIFAGGGTGGHIYPIIAIIRELKKHLSGLAVYFVAPDKASLKEMNQQKEIISKRILSGKLRRYLSLKNLVSPVLIFTGFIQALAYLLKIKPSLVFLKGGYGALPLGLAALALKLPIIVHESDTYPGLITRLFASRAEIVLTSFQETKNYLRKGIKIRLTGNPVRKLNQKEKNQQDAKKILGLSEQKKALLVLGGSQGSSEINELIFNTKNNLLVNFSIIHAVGKDKFRDFKKRISQRKRSNDYQIYPYLKEKKLSLALTAADLVIARSGAGLIFEIAQAGKPSILIPLANAASNHQRKNAYSYMSAGACLVIEKPNSQQGVFLKELSRLSNNQERIKKMTAAAKRFAKPDASSEIASLILNILAKKQD